MLVLRLVLATTPLAYQRDILTTRLHSRGVAVNLGEVASSNLTDKRVIVLEVLNVVHGCLLRLGSSLVNLLHQIRPVIVVAKVWHKLD